MGSERSGPSGCPEMPGLAGGISTTGGSRVSKASRMGSVSRVSYLCRGDGDLKVSKASRMGSGSRVPKASGI